MKYFKHTLGFVLVALGIVGIIHAKLGASPLDAFNVFLYTLLNEHQVPVTLGTVIFVIGTIVTLFTFLLTKDKSLVISFVFLLFLSVIVDGWNYLFAFIPESIISHIAFRIADAAIAYAILCFGVALTLSTGLPASPYEKLMLHIDKSINNISISKIFIDGTFFIAAIILGWITGHLFEQVFIMTIIIAFFTGIVVKYFLMIIQKKKKRE